MTSASTSAGLVVLRPQLESDVLCIWALGSTPSPPAPGRRPIVLASSAPSWVGTELARDPSRRRDAELRSTRVPLVASIWTDVFSAAGSVAAVLAAVGGALVAVRYGRKATAQVEAAAYEAAGTLVLAARPSVRAVGVFRLTFREEQGCTITVTEVWTTQSGLAEGRQWQTEAVFGPNFVEAGETIWTTVLFELGPPAERLIGWRVVLNIAVTRRFQREREWTWDDRIFVPTPTIRPVNSAHE